MMAEVAEKSCSGGSTLGEPLLPDRAESEELAEGEGALRRPEERGLVAPVKLRRGEGGSLTELSESGGEGEGRLLLCVCE